MGAADCQAWRIVAIRSRVNVIVNVAIAPPVLSNTIISDMYTISIPDINIFDMKVAAGNFYV